MFVKVIVVLWRKNCRKLFGQKVTAQSPWHLLSGHHFTESVQLHPYDLTGYHGHRSLCQRRLLDQLIKRDLLELGLHFRCREEAGALHCDYVLGVVHNQNPRHYSANDWHVHDC